jgi:hypothetical protein
MTRSLPVQAALDHLDDTLSKHLQDSAGRESVSSAGSGPIDPDFMR